MRLPRLLSSGALVLACGACSIEGGDKKTYRVPSAGDGAHDPLRRCAARKGVYVKCVVGLPGETVGERTGGLVYVDGRKLDERYVAAGRRDDGVVGRWRVPNGQYFVLGDTVPTHAAGARCPRRTSSGASSRSSTEAEPLAAR